MKSCIVSIYLYQDMVWQQKYQLSVLIQVMLNNIFAFQARFLCGFECNGAALLKNCCASERVFCCGCAAFQVSHKSTHLMSLPPICMPNVCNVHVVRKWWRGQKVASITGQGRSITSMWTSTHFPHKGSSCFALPTTDAPAPPAAAAAAAAICTARVLHACWQLDVYVVPLMGYISWCVTYSTVRTVSYHHSSWI